MRSRTHGWKLLPWMAADELRELLGEGGAHACHQRGVRDLRDPASWPAVAAVLGALHGDPGALLDGEPLA